MPEYLARAVAACRRAWWWARELFGEHDYARYVGDWHARHPDGPDLAKGHRPMTEREFFDERLRLKYGNGLRRC